MASTLIFITGATSGIGAALAQSVPYSDARVVNIARRENPLCDRNIQADLTDIAQWDIVIEHMRDELAAFSGQRAIFINNALVSFPGFVGELDAELHRKQLLANTVAPLVLGEAFLRLVPSDVEGGLVMVSSASARVVYAGLAAYGAAKAAIEQWVRAVRVELAMRQANRWVVAIRPGAVDTPSLRASAEADVTANPVAPELRQALADGRIDSPEVAAQRMWASLPPDPDGSGIVLLGELVEPPTPPTK